MRRGLVGLVLAAVMLVPAGAIAQSPTAPMPWADYRAAAQAFVDLSAAPSASAAPVTMDSIRATVEAGLLKWQAELDRLAMIAPEACYAEAHAAYLAFRTDELANYRDAMPMLDAADSQMGVVMIALMVQGILAKAHPLAFPETSPKPGVYTMGPTLNAMNVLDALQECEPE